MRVLWQGSAGAGRRSPTSTFAAGRACPRSAARNAADCGPRRSRCNRRSVYGLGEKFGPLDKRGQLIHSQVEDALGVNTGLAYKNTPFAWSPGTGNGAWGTFVHTPGMVTHGVGHPDWSHRSYAIVVDDEALDLFVFAADTPAGVLDALHRAHRKAPAVPRWSLGLWVSRAYYKTPEEALEVAQKLREHRIPCDVLTLDGRAAWNTSRRASTSNGIPNASPIRGPRSRDPGARSQGLRLGISVRVDPFAAVPASSRSAATC